MIKTRTIKIVDYDLQWSLVFTDLKRVLEAALGNLALSIEHVGSTSVPGLAAKPIIDLDVVIESNARLPGVIQSLYQLGYVHQGDLGIVGREAFDRQGQDVPRDGTGRMWSNHHLYVCAQDSAELARHLAFRDHLRKNPDAVLAYGKLKRQLAQEFPHDIESYIQGKRAFVEEILQRASLMGSDRLSQ
jgi:GrpB-like predicted nucleotidyltransferase (UPF0157 family)